MSEAPATGGQRLVVVPRRVTRHGARRRTGHGWTLHLADCFHVARSATVMPAPARPYPETVPCIYCRPEGDAQAPRERGKLTERGEPRKRHLYKYIAVMTNDGRERVRAECQLCGIFGNGPSRTAAKAQAYRRHRAADGRGSK